MPDMSFFMNEFGQYNLFIADACSIHSCNFSSSFIICRQSFELCSQHGGMKFIQPAVDTLYQVVVFFMGTVVPECLHHLCQCIVVGGNRTTIAQRAEVLPRVKAEATRMTQVAAFHSVLCGAVRLCGIFDDQEPVLFCNPVDGFHIAELPI